MEKRIQDFMLHQEASLKDNEKYVLLKAGRGRGENGEVYIDAITFSYIEGLLWDKYRGYGTRKKTKILSSEWNRIIDGFDEGISGLRSKNDGDDLKKVLKFNLVNPKNSLEDLNGHLSELEKLIEEMNDWLKVQVKEEKFITIVKEYL